MKTPFVLIFVLWGAGLGAAAQYAKISVVFDQLPALYPEAGAALGFIVSLVGFVGILLGVVAGLVVARIRFRRAIVLALLAGALVSFVQAVLPPLPWLLATRVLEGMSHLAIVVAAPTLIAQMSAPQHRGFALTLWGTFFGVAFTLLVVLGLPLVEARGVGALFVAHGLWMGAFAGLLSVMLPRTEEAAPKTELSLPHILRDHAQIYRSAYMGAPAIGWLFYTLCFLSILTVLPPFIPETARAWTLGAMPLASIVSSLTIGVFLLRYITAIQVVQLGFAACILCLGWLWVAPGLPMACLALSAALGLVQGATFAAVPQLNSTAQTQAKANGAMAQMGNLGNTLGTPGALLVLSLAGYAGLIATVIAIFVCAIAVHAVLAGRRSRDN